MGDPGRTGGHRDDARGPSVDRQIGGGGHRCSGRSGWRRRCDGNRRGVTLADRVAHDGDDLVVGLRGTQAAGEVVLHQAARELGQHSEVRFGGALGSCDEEDQIGGAVGSPEVHSGRQARERERRLGDC